MFKKFFLILVMLSASTVFAVDESYTYSGDEDYQYEEDVNYDNEYEFDDENDLEALQIGSQFERTFLREGSEVPFSENLKQVARSTAEFGMGSSFYVGEFGGRHIMATNAHVMMAFAEGEWTAEHYIENPVAACRIFPSDEESEFNYVRFSLVQKEYECKKLIGLWPEIDFALFEIDVTDGYDFKGMGISIGDFRKHFKGQELTMFSYGTYENPGMYEFDLAHTTGEQCAVFSDEARILTSDEEGSVGVWSVATGCDISVGDSGSAVVDLSGDFVGIIWSGAFDKSGMVQDDVHLKAVLEGHNDDEQMIWSQMNYLVPASKVVEVIFSDLIDLNEEKTLLHGIFKRPLP